MTTITIARPTNVAAPRGAAWAATAAARLLAWWDAHATRRAVVRAHADRVSEAAEVRRLADSWRPVDSRFAADLYAAADRHERAGA